MYTKIEISANSTSPRPKGGGRKASNFDFKNCRKFLKNNEKNFFLPLAYFKISYEFSFFNKLALHIRFSYFFYELCKHVNTEHNKYYYKLERLMGDVFIVQWGGLQSIFTQGVPRAMDISHLRISQRKRSYVICTEFTAIVWQIPWKKHIFMHFYGCQPIFFHEQPIFSIIFLDFRIRN